MISRSSHALTRWPRAASVVLCAFALVGLVTIALGQDPQPTDPAENNDNAAGNASGNNGLSAEAGDREVVVPVYAVRILDNAPETTAQVRALPGEFGPDSDLVARVVYELRVYPEGFDGYIASASVDFANADASARDWWTREFQLGTPAPGVHVFELPVAKPGTFWVQLKLKPRAIDAPGEPGSGSAQVIPGTVAESRRVSIEAVAIPDSAITALPATATAVSTQVRYPAVGDAGARRIELAYEVAIAIDRDVATRHDLRLTVSSTASWSSGGGESNPLLRNLQPSAREESMGRVEVEHHAGEGWDVAAAADDDDADAATTDAPDHVTITRRDDGALVLAFRADASVPASAQSEWLLLTAALSVSALDDASLPPALANWRAEVIVTAQLFNEPPHGRSVFTGRVNGVAQPIEFELPFRWEQAEEVVE